MKTLQPFEILFRPLPLVAPGKTLRWVRFYADLQAACLDVTDVLAREYPYAEISAVRQIAREAI